MHLDVCWCCNSHGDLAKILEKTCPRSPYKENFTNCMETLSATCWNVPAQRADYCNEAGNYYIVFS